MVHHQDIRQALGHSRKIPIERASIALGVLRKLPFLTSRGVSRQLSLVASDSDLRFGIGPDVEVPTDVQLMACAGRQELDTPTNPHA